MTSLTSSSAPPSAKVSPVLPTAAGAFGNVRVGWAKSNKSQKYAVKTMKKGEIIKSKHVDHIENEKNILEKIQHPFVVSSAG